MGGGIHPAFSEEVMTANRSMASASLREFGQLQRVVMGLNLVTGATIWAIAGMMKTDVAREEVYGDFITAINAEWWAIPLCLGAALHLIAQVVNGDRRLASWITPLARLLGSAVCFMVMALFVAGSFWAPMGLFVSVHFVQSFAFALICAWFCHMAAGDLRSGIEAHRANERSRI